MRRYVILVTGTRHATDEHREFIWATLSETSMSTRLEPHLVVGDAQGVDDLAHEWARTNDVMVARFRADWKLLGRSAGPLRNQNMVRYCCEQRDRGDRLVCLGFPAENLSSRGTDNCMDTARRAGIEVRKHPLTVAAGDRERVEK